MTSLNPPKHGTFKVSAICKQGRPFGVRASGVLVLQTGTDPKTRLPARVSNSVASPHFGNGIAADSSPLRRRILAAGKLERCGPVFALAIPAALFSKPYKGPCGLLICKLRGAFQALRSLLSFSLVPVSPKTTSGIFQRLFFAPVLSSVPVLHADNKAWSRTHEAQRNRASGAKRYE
jgi:hypothetical protein